MSEYDTGNPVPSASMPDAWDNMQSIDMFANSSDETITTRTGKQLDTLHGINVKSDNQRTEQQDSFELSQSERASSFEEKSNEFESRFSSQLSTQESTFSESQTDKENRFQQFLLSSGYVFLGDYENGPFQFSARNQYIRYNNQYYRLNAATDVGFTTTGTDATSFANDVTHFVLMDGDTLRQEMSAPSGAELISFRNSKLYGILNRFLTLIDIGAKRPALGRDLVADSEIWNAQNDEDIKHRGGFFTAKKTRGIRQHAAVMSVRGNTEGSGAFTPQVAGSDDLSNIAVGGSLDGVALYSDIWGLAYEDWESIDNVIYSANSFTVTSNYASSVEKMLIGDLIRTKHPSPYVGLITEINGLNITVQKWVLYGTTQTGTPSSDYGLYLNPLTKIWGLNVNVGLSENTRAEKTALAEFGLINNGRSDITLVTGVDVVVLAGTYGGGTAYRMRGTSSDNRWDTGYSAAGAARVNFRSSDGPNGVSCALAAYIEESHSSIGFQFYGNNLNRSLSWKDAAKNIESKGLSPVGYKISDGSNFNTAQNGVAITGNAYVWVVGNTSNFSCVLPDPTTITVGREFEFILTSTGTVSFSCANGTVNGQATFNVTPSLGFSRAKALCASNGLWYLTR